MSTALHAPATGRKSALRAAAARLVEAGAAAGAHQIELPEAVLELVGAVEEVLGGGDPAIVRRALPIRSRRPGLLVALRRTVLEQALPVAGGAEDASETLEILHALEQLAGSGETDVGDSATLRLLLDEPDAFQLLVEVAHDLRSPLTSVLFLSEALRGGFSGEVNELQRSQLGLMYSAALGLQAMVSDVMDLAATGPRGYDPPAPLSIRTIFSNLKEVVQPVAEEKGIELRFSAPLADRYLGQSLLIGRVLLNLVTNGLKFTEEGYVEVEARQVKRSRMCFSVRDTGRGFDQEKKNTLFEPFKKSDDRRGYFFSRAGLGLTIARRMLRTMDSELHFESRPGWGTRFFFELHMPLDRSA